MKARFKRKRISPKDILHAIEDDEEMYQLLSSCIVPGAGVRPYIHPKLLAKKGVRKSTKKKNQ